MGRRKATRDRSDDAPEARAGSSSWRIRLAVFVCGAAVMAVEILGTRLIGPHFGVGLFVWTALISVESCFSPGAKSRTNDHGLMQLHGRRIYDIEANIQAGCAHFAGNLAAARGDEYKALCYYNGGPKGPGYGQCQRYARKVLGIAAKVPASGVTLAVN